MKKTIFTINLFLILFFAIIIISCKKKDTTAATPSTVNNPPVVPPAKGTGIGPFSGTWTGTIRVDDKHPNFCNYTSDPIAVKQEWSIKPDSSITIIETLLDSATTTPWTQNWTGRLYNLDSLLITTTKNINCFGASLPMTTQLRAKIVRTLDNKNTIMAKVDYPMCPPDCLFTFNYIIKQE